MIEDLVRKVKDKTEKRKSLHTNLSEEAFVRIRHIMEKYDLESIGEAIDLALFVYDRERKKKEEL